MCLLFPAHVSLFVAISLCALSFLCDPSPVREGERAWIFERRRHFGPVQFLFNESKTFSFDSFYITYHNLLTIVRLAFIILFLQRSQTLCSPHFVYSLTSWPIRQHVEKRRVLKREEQVPDSRLSFWTSLHNNISSSLLQILTRLRNKVLDIIRFVVAQNACNMNFIISK